MQRRLSFLVALSLWIASCGGAAVDTATSQPAPSTSSTVVSSFDWSACGDLECASIDVPLDRRRANSPALTLRAYRRVSKQPNSAHIPLIIHPGGPGADVRQAVESAGELLAPMIEDFDVYGLSTRGTFDGRAFDCVEFLDDVVTAMSDREAARSFADGCAVKNDDLMGRLGTLDTVDDLEDFRRLLGLDSVRFLGWSYGATVGAAWVLRFPESIKAMVLDAPADPRNTWAAQVPYVFRASKRAFVTALDNCDADETCRTDESLTSVYERVADAARQDTLRSGEIVVTRRQLSLALEMPLYSGSFLQLADALRAADDGDASLVVDLLFQRLGQTKDRQNDGGIETQIGVHCADMSREDIDASLEEFDEGEAMVGFSGSFEAICAEFPDAPRPLGVGFSQSIAKNRSVVVFASEGDPVIPFEVSSTLATESGWALRLVPKQQHLTVGFDEESTREAMQFLRAAR